MAELSQEKLKELYNSEDQGTDKKYSQEELRRLYDSKDPSVIDSFVTGGLNQFNLLSNLLGGVSALQSDSLNDRWKTDKVAPTGIDEETWKKASTSERYKLAKDLAQENIDRIENANPIASGAGNMAVGMLLPSGGGIAASAAGKLGAKAAGKVGANILGNAAEGAVQSAMFAEDGNRLKSAAMGAGIGSLIPAATAGASKVIKSGRLAKEYANRVDDIKAQRQTGMTAADRIEQEAQDQIKVKEQAAIDDSIPFVDNIRKDVESATEKSQVLDQQIVDNVRSLNKEQLKLMSEESGKGFNTLSREKDIDVDPLVKKFEDAIEKLDPDDPDVLIMQTEIERLKKSGGKISEYDLKKKINSWWNRVSASEYRDSKNGIWIPLSSRELMKVAGEARDLLVNKNQAYGDIVQPLSEKVQTIKRINENLNFDKGNKTIIGTLRGYKSNKAVRDSMDEYKKLTGFDLQPLVEQSNAIRLSTKAPSFNQNKDLVDILVNSNSKSTNYKNLENDLLSFDKANGTNYSQQLRDLRLKHDIDLLNKVRKYTTPKEGGSGETIFSKQAYNVIPEGVIKPVEKENAVDRILSTNRLQTRNKISKKNKKSRQMVEDISRFLTKEGENADDIIANNTRALENDVLFDAMGNSNINGSRRVNLGANVGEAVGEKLHEWLKSIPFAGKAYGSIVGAAIDKGLVQRSRREILERLMEAEKNPSKFWSPKSISDLSKRAGSRILAPQISNEMSRQEEAMQTWESLLNDKTAQVSKQKDTNLENFGRTG